MKQLLPALALGATALLAGTAHAHISIDQGTTHKSRYGGEHAVIKEGPCGLSGATRGSNVYTYEPGETITVEAVEYVRHPGYFRISFDQDGDDDFVDPATVKPLNRECMTLPSGAPDPLDKCGADDFYNDPSVLMDNLDPHVPAGADILKPLTYQWQVTLPDVECDNCTLQLIQVMTDVPLVHAPYNPTGAGEAIAPDDIYYQCIDLVLKSAGGTTGGTGGTDGADAGTEGSESSKSGGDDGGCSVAPAGRRGSPGGLLLGLGLGLAAGAARRTRRRN